MHPGRRILPWLRAASHASSPAEARHVDASIRRTSPVRGRSSWVFVVFLLAAIGLLGAVGIALIWGQLPYIPDGPSPLVADSIGERARRQSLAEAAAQDWAVELRSGLDCAGGMAVLWVSRRTSGAATPALSSGCERRPPRLIQAWLIADAGTKSVTATPLFPGGPEQPGPLAPDALQRMRLAAYSQWDTYALASGQAQGIDQYVPVRGVATDTVLLLRYGAAANPMAPRLIDERSLDHGVAIQRTRGLRLATDNSEAQRRWLSSAIWALLVAGLAAAIWHQRSLRLQKAQSDQQREEAEALRASAEQAQRELLVVNERLTDAVGEAQRQREEALTAQGTAEALRRVAEQAKAELKEANTLLTDALGVAQTQREEAMAAKVTADAQRREAEQAKAKLEAANERLEEEIGFRTDVEESSPVGLRVIDNEGRLLEVNGAFCAMAGVRREDVLERMPPYSYWPAEEADERRDLLDAILAGRIDGEGYQIEFVRPGSGGARWPAYVRANRLRSGRGWILSSVDLTEQHKRQQQLEQLKQQLESQWDCFIVGEQAVQMAHDVANHIAAIHQAANNLGRVIGSSGDSNAAKSLASIVGEVESSRIHLDNFAKQIRGELRYDPINIAATVNAAMLLVDAQAKASNTRILNQVNPLMPDQMLARIPLIQVLRNLMANSLRAMDTTSVLNRRIVIDERIDVEAPTASHPEGRHWLHLKVEDRGCGIDAGPNLIDDPQPRHERGQGLGLWLARRWVVRMGGSLRIQRTGPGGTEVLIVLPYQPQGACAA